MNGSTISFVVRLRFKFSISLLIAVVVSTVISSQAGASVLLPGPCDLSVVDNLCDAPGDVVEDAASSAVSGLFESAANSFGEAAEDLLVSVALSWTEIDTDSVTDGDAISLLQNDLRVLTSFVAVVALIAAFLRLAFSRNAVDAHQLGRGVIRLVIVSSAGLTFLFTAMEASDMFASELIDSSINTQIQEPGALLAFDLMGPGLTLVIGLLSIFTAIIQIGMLLLRSAVIVVLAGVWPLAAASSLFSSGDYLWKKISGWLLAFILYKPAAAICYAAALRLMRSSDESSGYISTIQGLTVLVLAIFALPALIKLLVPAVSSFGAGPSMLNSTKKGLTAAAAVYTGSASMAATSASMPSGSKSR